MSFSQIGSWLEHKDADYATGYQLYCSLSTNEVLKSFLKTPTSFNREKLRKELRNIYDAAIKTKEPEPVKIKPAAATEPLTFQMPLSTAPRKPVDSKKLPSDLQRLVSEKGQLFRSACAMHAQLNQARTGENGKLEYVLTNDERKKHAITIASHWKKIDLIWKQIDYFEEHGVRLSKGVIQIEEMGEYQLLLRKGSLRTYLTPKRIAKSKPEKVADFKEQLKRVEQRLAQIREEDEAF